MNTATVKENKLLTDDVYQITFTTENEFEFEAGQFITIKIDDKTPPCFRAYSIASAPEPDSKEFFLCIKKVPEGRGSNWIGNLKAGDKVNYIGPNGYFTYQRNDNNLLFIATGTGLAPFYSMISELLATNFQQKITLIFGVRHKKDLFYTKHFEELTQQYDNFKFITTLSKPETPNWQGNTGRVTKILQEMTVEENTDTYICGLTPMIESVTKILQEKGFPEAQIHFEKYN